MDKTEESGIISQIEQSLSSSGYSISGADAAVFQAEDSQSANYLISVFNGLFEVPQLVSDFEEGGILFVTPYAAGEIIN
ncbi:MAG: hypothetical protein RAK22_02920, partial [Nanoarchaeota archaeon]|nr:hypothetical protein [Nanoarchaeota archaeon]